MTRRLLGYVVKLADGTRSEHTRRPVSLVYASAHLCDDGWVVPVFSKPKPAELEPAPVVAAEGPKPAAWRIEYGPSDYGHTDSAERVARAKSQDAKVTPLYEAPPDGERGAAIRSAIEATLESAKERLLKTLAKGPLTETSIKACLFVARVNGVAESRPNLRNRERKLVRVLDDGAHEAALAAAREEGRREGAGRIARLVDALQNVLDGHSELTPHAIVEIEYVLEEEREEAAKGQAK